MWNYLKGIKRRQSDVLFSRLIRKIRGNRCEKCGRRHDESSTNIGLSHYRQRSREVVRYDPSNVDIFCNIPCHNYFEEHKKSYDSWKEERMGTKEYHALLIRAEQRGHWDRFI